MVKNGEVDWSISISSDEALAGEREELEVAIDDLLEEHGEVCGGRAGADGWSIEIELFGDPSNSAIIDELRELLREAGVSRSTRVEVVRRQHLSVYESAA